MDSNNLPSVEKVKATVPLTDLQAFDMMSRFLEAEKAKHLSLDIAGQSYLSTASQIWNDLRLACNSLLEQNDHRREPVVEWKMDADLLASPAPAEPTVEESTPLVFVPESAKSSTAPDTSDKEARRSTKKEKKELKRARKEEKKSAKKEKKEAKKKKKEAKKRKRESLST